MKKLFILGLFSVPLYPANADVYDPEDFVANESFYQEDTDSFDDYDENENYFDKIDSYLEEEESNMELDYQTIMQPNEEIIYIGNPKPANPKVMNLTVEAKKQPHIGTARNIANRMKSYYERVSRNKLVLKTNVRLYKAGPIKGNNNVRLVYVPGASSRVPVIGNAITASHELGHQLGLGHAHTRIWDSQTKVKSQGRSRDFTDPMTLSPGSKSLNAPHLHMKKWFNVKEIAQAEVGKEYILTVLNDGRKEFESLKALYYEVPSSGRKFWFSYVIKTGKGWKTPAGMPANRGIALHSTSGDGTFLEGLLGNNAKTLIRSGLKIEVVSASEKAVRIKINQDPNWVLKDK